MSSSQIYVGISNRYICQKDSHYYIICRYYIVSIFPFYKYWFIYIIRKIFKLFLQILKNDWCIQIIRKRFINYFFGTINCKYIKYIILYVNIFCLLSGFFFIKDRWKYPVIFHSLSKRQVYYSNDNLLLWILKLLKFTFIRVVQLDKRILWFDIVMDYTSQAERYSIRNDIIPSLPGSGFSSAIFFRHWTGKFKSR